MSGVGPYPQTTFHGQYDVTSVVITVTQALAFYNCFELLLLIFTTFNRWKGLYFWSLVIATLGTLSYSLGMILEYFVLGDRSTSLPGIIFDSTGWIFMVSGQSVVLYSRLGLIVTNQKILKAVKWMIIVDAVVFHITTNGLNFVAHWTRLRSARKGYFYFEYVQMTGFCIQEFIISGIYMWKTIELLKTTKRENSKRIIYQLFSINIIIVILDIALLAIEYKNLHIFEQCVKSFVYSVKLKLEFAILGKMVDLVKDSRLNMSFEAFADLDSYVDGSRRPSPVLERKVSPRARVGSVVSGYKGTVGHIEDQETGHVEEPPRSLHEMAAMDSRISPVDMEIGARRRKQGRESDIMYADILRAISRG